MNLNPREKELIVKSLNELADGLKNYLTWVNDHPMLPQTKVALEMVKSEEMELKNLAWKFMESKN